jgi:hypothetical protein
MDVAELFDRSPTVVLDRAAMLQERLRAADDAHRERVGGVDAIEQVIQGRLRQCRGELHQLVGDIVSIRNDADLLRRRRRGAARAA